ncbi:heparinase II/III family protein [Pelagibacteraceae bacterium]|nr:heparinase II/III family protein [Pelagibacteraceae bacterium]
MISLKTAYYYILAVKINFIKIFKKIYFTTGFYKKSLISKVPNQFFFLPNPFLMSSFSNYKKFAFQINNLDPNKFWDRNYSYKEKRELHNFFWLSSIDRKDDASTLRKIISLWNVENLKYRSLIWETSILSKRLMSWILNADIILKNSNFDFKRSFIESIVIQTNHLRKNFKYEIDYQKKIEVITVLILSGLVFKEYEDNYEYSLKELEKLIETFFDNSGFPLTRNPGDLLNYTKYFLLIKEVIKDAQKYVPDNLENILEKNLECLKQITTPTNSLPLFNGSIEDDLTNFYNYINHFNIKIKKPKINLSNIHVLKNKKDVIYFEAGNPPKKDFSSCYQSGPLSFEYYFDDQKIITNSGFGVNISKRARLLSRFTSSQSALCLNDTSIVGLERSNMMNKAYGFLIKRDFKVLNLKHKNDSNEIQVKAGHDAYLKNFGCTHNRSISIDKIDNKVVGQDNLMRESVNSKIKYDIRFHLYPGITAVQTIGGNTLLIQINKNKALLFSTNEKSLKIEKSIFFGGQKVLDNHCIVISGIMENNKKTIDWEIIKKT